MELGEAEPSSSPSLSGNLPLHPDRIRQSLRFSLQDAAYYGVMLGFGEAYLGAAGVFLGLSNRLQYLLGTSSAVFATFMQPLSAALTDRLQKRRAFYLTGTFLQALAWIPVTISLFLSSSHALPLFFASVALLFLSNHLATPPWSSTMGDLVPQAIRGSYFGSRNALIHVTQLGALVAAGVCLETFSQKNREAAGYAVLFAAAFVARLLSFRLLGKMADPPYRVSAKERYRVITFVRELRSSNFGRFVVFAAVMHMAVTIVSPFFAAFMLRELGLSYVEFMIANAVIIVFAVLSLPLWGRAADRYGGGFILRTTGLGIAITPLIWLFAEGVWGACVAQAMAGISWSGFSLVLGTFVLDSLPTAHRASGMAYLNSLIGLGTLLGGLAGAWLVEVIPTSYTIGGFVLAAASGFRPLLLVSFVLRSLTLVWLGASVREARVVPSASATQMMHQFLWARPRRAFMRALLPTRHDPPHRPP